MTTIWKYPLKREVRQYLSMPKGSTFLSAQTQHGQICLWYMVDDTEPLEKIVIHLYGTGSSIDRPENKTYLTSVQELQGNLVWHIFTYADPYKE